MANLKQVLAASVKLLDEYGNDGRALGIAYDNELSKLDDYDGAVPDIGLLVTHKGSTAWAPKPTPSPAPYKDYRVNEPVRPESLDGRPTTTLEYILKVARGDKGGNVEAHKLACEGIRLLAAAA